MGNVVFCLQWGFTYSHSTADLLTAVDDRIVKAFNNSSATGAVPCDISQVFDSAWHVGLLYRINSHRISHQSSGTLFGSLLEVFFQDYAIKAGISPLLLSQNYFPIDVVPNILMFSDATIIKSD